MKRALQIINDFLRDYPALRSALIIVIRYVQYFFASVNRKLKGVPDGFISKGKRLTPKGENCYFGYYDKSPYSTDGLYVIYHKIPSMNPPQKSDYAELFIQNLVDGSRKSLGRTKAWNLQQGAMLRFYDTHTVAWNDYRNNHYCTIFHNLDNDEERLIDTPLYDIDREGIHGLSLEFERLNVDAEGYGYIQEGLTSFITPAYISLVDIKNNVEKKIIDSDNLNKLFPIKHENISFFYFNHLNFNPSGTRFLFIERYVYMHKRYSRLFSSDINGENLHILLAEDMVSHFTWKDDETVMVFAKHNGRNAYYIIKDKYVPEIEEIHNDKLKEDGHPTFFPQSELFVSDTYPDHGRRRHLFVYDMETQRYKELASLKAPIKYDGPSRCDFHPRLHPANDKVCIDSIHEGFRGIYEIKI